MALTGFKLTGDYVTRQIPSHPSGGFVTKNFRICGSGIYAYGRSELATLGLGAIPSEHNNKYMFNVYRPPEVLEKHKDLFARVPIITGKHQAVNIDNAKGLAVGMVGDSVEIEQDANDGETYLYTTGTFFAGDGIAAAENLGELSVGYVPTCRWQNGIHKGVEYQAELTGYTDVNHLLICKTARGGHQCMVLDSESSPLEEMIKYIGGSMSFFSKILHTKTPKPKMAGDAKPEVVSALLNSIIAGADVAIQVTAIKGITGVLPAGDSKTEFEGFLDELVSGKDAPKDKFAEAVKKVDGYYQEHFTGDSDDPECPECHKTPCECKKAGDADKDKDKPAGDSSEFKTIAEKIVEEARKAVAEEFAKQQKIAGDAAEAAKKADEEKAKAALEANKSKVEMFNTTITGDSKKAATSDELMKTLFGGK